MYTPTELSVVLAKARPQVLFVPAGDEGEGRMRKALDLILQEGEKSPETSDDLLSSPHVQSWAKALASDWDRGRQSKTRKGELPLPMRQRRVWTVNLGGKTFGASDYYGSGARPDGVSTLADPRDWTHLLSPPPGHKHATQERDSISREAFTVRKLSREEQRRRVAVILWSSGTTGAPKGVLISHENMVASVTRSWTDSIHFRSPSVDNGEVWVGLAPWTHIMG